MSQTLFRNARVVDGLGNEPAQHDVLVDGERIAQIAAPNSIEAGAEVTVVEVAGRTLMPGLIDAHCHITFDETQSNDELFFHRRTALSAIIAARNVRKVLAAGVTSFVDADCIYDIGVDLRDAIDSGVIEGPRMSTGGYALLTSVGGTAGQLIPDSGTRGYAKVVSGKDEIVAEVRRQIKLGVDWIKVHVTGLVPRQKSKGEIKAWSLDELRTVCDTAHDLGVRVTGHCRNPESIRDAVDAGFDMILHGTFMDEPTLERVIEARVAVVPTFTFQANLADYGAAAGANPELQEIFRREIEESSATLRRAYDAGVPLLCGTETGFSLTPYGEWHYREMEIFIRDIGLTPLQAIACGTSAAADAVGLAGETGAVSEGYLADLLLVDGDPVRDITVLGQPGAIHAVYLGGRAIDLNREEPTRMPISGHRVSPYSSRILDRATAWQTGEST